MKWFAWFPVTTKDGKVSRLTHVSREWNWELNNWCDSSGHAGSCGGWEYE